MRPVQGKRAGHPPDGAKRHVGVFWVHPHFVGDKNLGEIRHTYKMDAPE